MLVLDDDPNLAESDLSYTTAILGSGRYPYKGKTVLVLGAAECACRMECMLTNGHADKQGAGMAGSFMKCSSWSQPTSSCWKLTRYEMYAGRGCLACQHLLSMPVANACCQCLLPTPVVT